MNDENSGSLTPPPFNKKPGDKMGRIVLYNLLGVLGYGVLCRAAGEGWFILDAILIGLHTLACIIAAPATGKMEWLLAAFLVACVGFGTCVGLGSLG